MNWYRFTPISPRRDCAKYPLRGEWQCTADNKADAIRQLNRHCWGFLDDDSFVCQQFDPDEEWKTGFKEFLKQYPSNGVDCTNGWAKTQGGNDF